MLLIREEREWILAFQFLEHGQLPRAGGWAQQDAIYVEIMRTISEVIGLVRRELTERATRDGG
ncbi:MAG: hypothetical protein GC151_13940 [Betaproteobacteria bacterium]|nr:hypothetical protein [Betaproteobacteria bacterium]